MDVEQRSCCSSMPSLTICSAASLARTLVTLQLICLTAMAAKLMRLPGEDYTCTRLDTAEEE